MSQAVIAALLALLRRNEQVGRDETSAARDGRLSRSAERVDAVDIALTVAQTRGLLC